MAGLIPTDTLRLPLVPADEAQREVIRAALDTVGVAVAS
jgi:dihydrodipicolinate synthase/N-acetylneuraminate lyase